MKIEVKFPEGKVLQTEYEVSELIRPYAEMVDRALGDYAKEITRLRSALEKYGNHKAGCKENDKFEPCQCGLDEALSSGGAG